MFLLNLLHCVTLIDRQSLTWNWHIPDNTTTLYLKNHVKRHKVISVVTVSLGCVSPLTILWSHYITIIVSMWDTLEFFDLVVNIIFVEARGILIFITGPFSSLSVSLSSLTLIFWLPQLTEYMDIGLIQTAKLSLCIIQIGFIIMIIIYRYKVE